MFLKKRSYAGGEGISNDTENKWTPPTVVQVMGTPQYMAGSLERISRICDCRVVSADYRLRPEATAEESINDCVTAYEWVLGLGVSPGNVALAGESGGGQAVMLAAQAIVDRGYVYRRLPFRSRAWRDFLKSASFTSSNHHRQACKAERGLAHCRRRIGCDGGQ